MISSVSGGDEGPISVKCVVVEPGWSLRRDLAYAKILQKQG